VLGVSLLVVQQKMSLLTSILFSLGSSLGFTLVIVLFAGIRSQLSLSKVPKSIQGNPIAFITAGVLSMAFMGFSGMA
jgi:electron transport complex protein RnfA